MEVRPMIRARSSAQPPAPRSQVHGGPVHTVQTWLREDPGGPVLAHCAGPPVQVAGRSLDISAHWPADALLVGAVEASVRADFMQLAERDGLAVAFYESTALGRWSVGDAPRLLDLDVHPRVGVHAAADAERTRSLFDQLAGGCLALRTLRAPVTLHPTVEIWTSRQPPPGGAAPA